MNQENTGRETEGQRGPAAGAARPNLVIGSLALDLRGLPRATAEAVPAHLAKSLERAFAYVSPPVSVPDSVHLTLDFEATPREVADAIARQIAGGKQRGPKSSPSFSTVA